MHPTLFRIPIPWHEALKFPQYLSVPAYGTMLMVGFLLAVWMARRRAAALGLGKIEIFDLGIFAIIGGVLGARLMHVAVYWPDYFVSHELWPRWMGPLGWLGAMVATWKGGLVFYGGLLGGMFALWLYTRRRKIPYIDVLDFAAAPAAVGLAMTRIGCFLNGCCFGHASDLPWAVTYPADSHVYARFNADGQLMGFCSPFAVHPTQLYETLAGLAMAALVWWLIWPRRRFAGQAAFAFGLLYSVWRFGNEFLRGDTFSSGPALAGRLTVFQHISIGLILAFGAAYLVARRIGRAPFKPPAPAEPGRPAA